MSTRCEHCDGQPATVPHPCAWCGVASLEQAVSVGYRVRNFEALLAELAELRRKAALWDEHEEAVTLCDGGGVIMSNGPTSAEPCPGCRACS